MFLPDDGTVAVLMGGGAGTRGQHREIEEENCQETHILFESGKHVLGRLDEQNWFTGRRRETGRIVIASYHGRLEQACRRLAVTLVNDQAAAPLSLEEAAKRIEEITGKLARAIVLQTEQPRVRASAVGGGW